MYRIFRTVFSVPCTVFSVAYFCTAFLLRIFCTVFTVPYFLHRILCTVFSVPYLLYRNSVSQIYDEYWQTFVADFWQMLANTWHIFLTNVSQQLSHMFDNCWPTIFTDFWRMFANICYRSMTNVGQHLTPNSVPYVLYRIFCTDFLHLIICIACSLTHFCTALFVQHLL